MGGIPFVEEGHSHYTLQYLIENVWGYTLIQD